MSSVVRPSIPKGVRIGSVPYLNSVPLTWGLDREIAYLPPSQLALALRHGDLDAALVSITEVLFENHYRILDGIGVCSNGPVNSVFLAHRVPLSEAREIYCDPASLTSLNLLNVLLRRQGIQPEWRVLKNYAEAGNHSNVMLIGNPAIQFRREHRQHEIWDLGEAWTQEMHLPFVYAVWAIRNDVTDMALLKKLKQAHIRGKANLESVINNYYEFDMPFRRRYLTQHIHHDLGEPEKRGIARFVHELRQFSGLEVYDPSYIDLS